MKRKFLIFLCLILFFVSVSAVSAAEDANQTITDDINKVISTGDTLSVSAIEDVNQTIDNTKDMGTLSVSENIDVISAKDAGTFTALQEKINNAREGSTINLENDYKYDSGFSTDGITINKELTIDGKGYAIDGNNMARIFNIGGNVVLKNIIIQNGKINDGGDGGAINIKANSIISCIHCTFINNTADGDGGAIRVVHGSNISISDCTFINNGVPNLGNDAGGAIYIFYANAKITNSIFKDNYAVRGGAIYVAGDDASIVVDTSEFTNNLAYNYGGAIFWNSRGDVTNSKFTKNTALNHNADAIYLSINHNKILNNCDFINKYDEDDSIYFSKTYVSTELNLSNLNFKNDLNDYGGLISVKDNILTFGGVGDVVPTKNVVVSIGGKTYEDSLKQEGIVNIDLSDLPARVYDARISYGNSMNINLPITIGSSTVLSVPDVTKDYGGSEQLQITLTEEGSPVANAKVNININENDYTRTTDSNGKASMPINLNAGTYVATVSYQDISTKAIVTVNKLASKTSLAYAKNSHNSVTLTASVNPSSAGGKVTFNVNGKDYNATVSGAKATYTLNNLAVGSYDAKATYGGDINHKSSSSSNVKFTVEEYSIIVSAPDVTKYYGGDERFVVTVTDNTGKAIANEPVKVTINGQVYDRKTGADGRTTFAINLRSGTHEATTEHDGEVIKSTITVKTTVISKDVTKIFRNGTNYEASFLDKNGNKAPAGGKVSININGVFYQRTIKDDGSISFALNLEQGTYVLTMTNPYTGEEISNTVKILPNIVENKDLVKYYRNGSQFTFKLLDDKGNPASGQKASININGVFYTRTTNDKCIATFQINLEPGTYILTMEYKGCRVSNTVTVKPVLTASDLTKQFGDLTPFSAKLVDGHGLPAVAKTITFNINGVFYNRTTDLLGIARLNINLLPGVYIITSLYGENNAITSNKVTITSILG